MTADAARVARRIAAVAGEAARIEARWLIDAAGGDSAVLEALVIRRLAGEPVDRVIGSRGFWTLDLKVSPDVLSPRSDTETVVRAALEQVRVLGLQQAPLRILDLGTGTGAILLALLAELPEAAGIGVDVSPAAIAIANENAMRNGLHRRATFQTGDWAVGLEGVFDIVVSNPPYIPTGEIAGLDREVHDFDPHLALDGGLDGLNPYRRIFGQIAPLVAAKGIIVLEFGLNQGRSIEAIARSSGFDVIRFRNDLSGIERTVILNKI